MSSHILITERHCIAYSRTLGRTKINVKLYSDWYELLSLSIGRTKYKPVVTHPVDEILVDSHLNDSES